MDALIPSLVLQPMIENSIKHGFSRRIDASRIDIAIRRDGDALVVTVEDDGPGVPPGWDLATHCGRGLKNVIERLEKLYPGDWGFTVSATSRRAARSPGCGSRGRSSRRRHRSRSPLAGALAPVSALTRERPAPSRHRRYFSAPFCSPAIARGISVSTPRKSSSEYFAL